MKLIVVGDFRIVPDEHACPDPKAGCFVKVWIYRCTELLWKTTLNCRSTGHWTAAPGNELSGWKQDFHVRATGPIKVEGWARSGVATVFPWNPPVTIDVPQPAFWLDGLAATAKKSPQPESKKTEKAGENLGTLTENPLSSVERIADEEFERREREKEEEDRSNRFSRIEWES